MSGHQGTGWDGRPEDPEQDGWHWLMALPGKAQPGREGPWPVQWVAKYDTWNGCYQPAYAIEHWRYLAPCPMPEVPAHD